MYISGIDIDWIVDVFSVSCRPLMIEGQVEPLAMVVLECSPQETESHGMVHSGELSSMMNVVLQWWVCSHITKCYDMWEHIEVSFGLV